MSDSTEQVRSIDGQPGNTKLLWGMPRQLVLSIAGVAFGIVVVAAVLVWYVIYRKPIGELPIINSNQPPKFSYNIGNVTRPLGIGISPDGSKLYVAQSSGDRLVAVVGTDGTAIGSLAAPNKKGIHTPAYIAVDSSGKVFVTDRGTNQLFVYDSEGKYLNEIKPEGIKNWGPLAIAVARDDTLYVSDANAEPQVVWHIDSTGKVIAKIGADEGLSFVNGLAVQSDDSLLVSDSNHGRVLVYDKTGAIAGALLQGEAVAPIGLPRGIAVSDSGRIFIADTTAQEVRVYKEDSSGVPSFSSEFGTIGSMDGQFGFPNGVAADTHGHIYVTDRENNRVQVWVVQ